MTLSRLSRHLAATAVVALALAGCAAKGTAVGTHGGPQVTGSIDLTPNQAQRATQEWGARYDRNPKDRATILNFAAALRLNQQTEQAVAVLRKGVILFPKDVEVASAYGKALAANGDFEQALKVIRSAQRSDRPDWKLFSAEGAILDQMGQTGDARDRYAKALAIAPGEPSVLNNMALSHLLAGEIERAETLLRQAAQSPAATSRIRQNLALVLGLQGRFQEAEAVAANELDPAQAQTNIAYLKSMLAQANAAGGKRAG